MKYHESRQYYEVPLINSLKSEDLRKLNSLFNTTYKPEKLSQVKIIELVNLNDEIDRLMRAKPLGGGWCIKR